MLKIADVHSIHKALVCSIHPDKFVSLSVDAFSRNTKMVQILSVLTAALDNSGSSVKRSGDLTGDILSLYPPFSWYIYKNELQEVALNTHSANLLKKRLYRSGADSFLITSLLKEIYLLSKMDNKILSEPRGISHQDFQVINKNPSTLPICGEASHFSRLFGHRCAAEDQRLLGSRFLSQLNNSSLDTFLLFRKGIPLFKKNPVSRPCPNTVSSREQVVSYKKPVSFLEYRARCEGSATELGDFFATSS